MAHAIARQRQLNPKDLFDDVHDLARVNPEKLAKDVVTLARKKNSADGMLDAASHATGMLGGTFFALLTTGAVGWWAGKQNAERDAMLAEWESQGNTLASGVRCSPWEVGVKDPTIAFWKIPKLALPPLISAAAWMLLRRRRRKSTKGKRSIAGGGEVFFFMNMILGSGLLLAQSLSNVGYCGIEKQITGGTKTVDITPKTGT